MFFMGLVYYLYKYWCNGCKLFGYYVYCLVWGKGGGLYWNSCCFLFKLLILIIKSIYVYLDFVIISYKMNVVKFS